MLMLSMDRHSSVAAVEMLLETSRPHWFQQQTGRRARV